MAITLCDCILVTIHYSKYRDQEKESTSDYAKQLSRIVAVEIQQPSGQKD